MQWTGINRFAFLSFLAVSAVTLLLTAGAPARGQDSEWVPSTVTGDGSVIPGFWAGCVDGCGGSGSGSGGESSGSFDGVDVGFDFSPEIVDALISSLVGFDRDAAAGGDGSAEKNFKRIVNQLKNIGNLMPNRGPLGGDWDPATADRWREGFALQWHIKPVLFTIPDDLNTAWAQFFRERALREQGATAATPNSTAA